MVADVTETRNVIPSLEFKTCMTIKSYFYCFLISTIYQSKIITSQSQSAKKKIISINTAFAISHSKVIKSV